MKPYRQQQQNRPKKSTLVIGREIVLQALKTGKELERIFLQNEAHGADIEAIKAAAMQAQV